MSVPVFNLIFTPEEIYEDVLQYVFDLLHCEDRPADLTPVTVIEAADMLETWRRFDDDGDLPPGINPDNLARAWNEALDRCNKNFF